LKPPKPLTRSHSYSGICFRCLIETSQAASLVSLISSDYLEFLGDFEDICKTALARESGPYGGLIDEKTECRKSRDTVPLNTEID
jgi:hypothetical protein